MKKFINKSAAALCCAAAVLLTACTSTPTPSFDTNRPWHDISDSYERLTYEINIYNTEKGTSAEKRVKIATGEAVFTLEENVSTEDVARHTGLNMTWTVTYNDDADEKDRGLTDNIRSYVEWQTDSLVTAKVNKKVGLARREGEEKNNSYEINADYFAKKATRITFDKDGNEKQKTLSIPSGQYYDNEMMFYLARTSSISANTAYPFFMTNLFDCFETGKVNAYTMYVSTEADKITEHIGDWVKDFGIEKVTSDATGNEYYPVSCYDSSISINAERHGPPYRVSYSAVPFVSGEKEHKKIPVRISYDSYRSGIVAMRTEYVLTGCSFDKE